MRTLFKTIAALVFLLNAAAWAQAADQSLYKATLIQAAPGKLLELLKRYKSAGEKSPGIDDAPLLWMRHSQGDHWDLMILHPLATPSAYSRCGAAVLENSAVEGMAKKDGLVAWQEDTFVHGPPPAEVKKRFASAGFFHVEMFVALPGKDRELYKEREMENDYLRRLKAPDNLIFTRESGGAWDLFTIGFYRDLKDYAEAADRPQADQDAAAKAAGFESPRAIGPYLRTLISTHHDTLAVAIK